MATSIPFPKGTVKRMDKLLSGKLSVREHRRVTTIRLLALGWEAQDVADAVGDSRSSVYRRKSEFLAQGEQALMSERRGGRRNALMSAEEEREFVAGFERAARDGELVTAQAMLSDLSERVGRRVGATTLYGLLHRNGWRKVMPRPAHPNTDTDRQEAFKETSLTWSPKPAKQIRVG